MKGLIHWIGLNFQFFLLTQGNNQHYPKEPFPNQILEGQSRIESPSEVWSTSKSKIRAGIISYDFKNQIENLSSEKPAFFDLPDVVFFEADLQITWDNSRLISNCPLPEDVWIGKIPKSKKPKVRLRALTDQDNKKSLVESEKERAENLIITDLMRNDLSKVSKTGTVQVPELFGIYSFPKVHQMISTVTSELKPVTNFWDIICATFPMGSMTGAPKIKTMELIEEYEDFKRGWFSGALGFIDPSGDFDFSVVIRSILIDQTSQKLYFAVGSAITIDADGAQEYEECLLKASAILEVLSGK